MAKNNKRKEIFGTEADDQMSGTAGHDQLNGLGGNDEITGMSGNDHLKGGDGDDLLSGGEGNDQLDGGMGNDVLNGDAGNDKLVGGEGNDVITGGEGNDTVKAGDGDDTIFWQAGDGNDNVDGGAGHDAFNLKTSDDIQQTVQLSTTEEGELAVLIEGDDGTEMTLRNIEDFVLEFGAAGGSLDLSGVTGAISEDPIDLSGGEGGDVINAEGSDQAVNVDAGTGDDEVTGGNADDIISGGEGADVITGGGGDDVIDAGVGDDQVIWAAGDGNDVIDGGDGFDELDISLDDPEPTEMTIGKDADGNVLLTQPDGTVVTVDGVEDIVVNASAGGTTLVIGDLTGTDIAQDTLYFMGGVGEDYLDASGTDRRINAQGNDGDDTLISGSGNDTLDGGAGNDYLDAGSGSGVDTVLGGAGDDTIHFTLGDEQGSDATDIADGGADNDTLQVTFVEPTPHDLVLKVASNGDGTITITSEDIDVDEILYVSNVEKLQLIAGEGALSFELGALGDSSVVANGVDFEGSADGDAFNASQTDVATLQNGYGGDDNLIGGSADDTLSGQDGDDSLAGGDGNDVLNGGIGNDVIDGGQGVDLIWFGDAAVGITVDLSNFSAQDTNVGIDTIVNVEDVVGSDFDDVIVGSDADNVLQGGAGNDDISGGAGFDFLFGGEGDDTLTDTLYGVQSGDAGNDTITGFAGYFNDPSAVTLDLSAGTAIDGYGDTDTLNVSGAVLSSYDDTVIGSDNGETIYDRAGADNLSLGAGDDLIVAGSGNDAYDGGDGQDVLSYQDDGFDAAGPATQGVVVDLGAGTATDGFGDTDSISNVEVVVGSEMADTITGDSLDNVLLGRTGDDVLDGGDGNDFIGGHIGNDTMIGGAGDDQLNGGLGDDTLTGGAGADQFDFVTIFSPNDDFGHDTITDFDVAEDVMDLSPHGITSLADVQAIASEADGNTILTIDSERSITLTGVTVAELGVANFVFADAQDPTTGTEDNDNLVGTAGDDVLLGLGGFDQLEGGAGNDTLDGGDDIDYAIYFFDPAGVTVDLSTGTATDGYGGTDTLISIENVDGSEFNDVITGNSDHNILWGNGGDDQLIGGAGDDSFVPGVGVDSIDGGDGFDVVYHSSDGIPFGFPPGSSPGLDITFNGDGSFTTTNLTNGIVETSFNVEGVTASIGADTIIGDANDNFIQGFFGQNIIDGAGGNDTVFHTLSLGDGVAVDLSQGTAEVIDRPWFGVDSISNVENVIGSPLDDVITGDAGNNILEGINGNDVIRGLAGDDFINGGQSSLVWYFGDPDPAFDGFDVADYSLDPAAVTVNLTTNTAFDGFGGTDTLNSIEGVIGSPFNDTITGNASPNVYVLADDGDNNAIIGDDTITDFVVGEDLLNVEQFHNIQSVGDLSIVQDGADTVITIEAGNSVRLLGVTATDIDDNSFQFVQNQNIVGTPADDQLQGGDGNDFIDGLEGNDNIQGGAGADFILAGPGSDFVQGGADNDTIDGGNDNDYDHLEGGSGDDIINAGTGGSFLGGQEGNDTLTGVPNDWDHIEGGPGDDVLIDPDGSGFLIGGPGNDTLDGRFHYESDPSGVVVNLAETDWDVNGGGSLIVLSDTALDGYGDTDTLLGDVQWREVITSQFDDQVQGSDFSETFRLRAGDDVALGGAGDDNFAPGSGSDYIDGGDGWDNLDYYDNYGDPQGDPTQGVVLNLSTSDFNYGAGVALANSAIDGYGDTDVILNVEHVYGSPLDDVIIGTDEHNWLQGNEGNDLIFGGDTGDNLQGNAGNDLLDGQGGEWDTVWYNWDGGFQGVNVNLELGTATDTYGDTDTLVSIENVEGSQFDDVIVGSSANNWFAGNDGNDVIYGGDGDDGFSDRDGNDQSFGEGGNDWFEASPGDDLLDGGAGDYDHVSYAPWVGTTSGINVDLTAIGDFGGFTNVVQTPDGFGGTDYLRGIENVEGTDHDDTLIGDANNNDFRGFGGNDTLVGGDGNDWLDGGDDFDVIDGGSGDDFIFGGENDDILTGGSGRDQFHFRAFTDQGNPTSLGENVIMDFNVNEDVLDLWNVPQFNNLQSLNAVQQGSDVLISYVDSPNGIPETSSILIQNIQVSDLQDMEIWYAPIEGGDGDDVLNGTSFDDNMFGRDGNDILNGFAGTDDMHGEAGDDQLFGGDDHDRLHGGPGNDLLDGGGADDTAQYRWSGETQGVVVDLAAGLATNDGFGTTDTLVDIESVQGSEFDDQITGDAGNNNLNGEEGNDTISGGDGHDWVGGQSGNDFLSGGLGNDDLEGGDGDDQLFAGDGHDSLRGGNGNDLLDGGLGDDWVYYRWSGETNGVVVDLSLGSASNDGFGTSDTLISIENVSGSEHDDQITGDAQNNGLQGNEGNDVLIGGDGGDWFGGGPGNDIIDGGAGWDSVNYDQWTGVTQAVDVNLETGVVSNDGFGTSDTVSNVEHVNGTDFDDVITTSSTADNHINGHGGNDLLIHSGGNDGFDGGSGDDTFVLSDGGGVWIGDFTAGAGTEDKIDFSGVSALGDFATVIANASDDGTGNVNIDLGSGFNLHLAGVNLADLHPDDFVF